MEPFDKCLEKFDEFIAFLASSDNAMAHASVEMMNGRDCYVPWRRRLLRLSHELTDCLSNVHKFFPDLPDSYALTVLNQELADLSGGVAVIHLINVRPRYELLEMVK